ncbi:heavy metal transporter [Streptomyces sp. NBC_01207]|uniref:heavy metal transporter n=1 Tax=Streptomyces sp. NBC_01207 TaxID=2903772 RepID=UPI002E159347|nr:heavy metal transporter [Streptomyces sp. NBC_01207]
MKLFSRKNKTEADTGQSVELLIEGMHRTSSGLLIDDELEDLPGDRSATRDTRTGRSTVRLDEGAHADVATLVAAVEGAGDHTARLAD